MNQMRHDLATDGYAIVPCFDQATAAAYLQEFKEWRSIVQPPVPPHGVLKHYKVGHLAVSWKIRVDNRVTTPFKTILGTSDLVASFDGWGYQPQGLKRRNTSWFHIDQEPNDLSFKCVQGLVALTSNTNASFQCIPGSHTLVKRYFQGRPPKYPGKRWQRVDLSEFNRICETDLGAETVALNAGDLLLWDSRLIHQNAYAADEERAVCYVSYRSRQGLSPAQRSKRLRAFQDQRMTSHWAYPVELNATQPQVWGDATKLINYETLPPIEYPPELLSQIKQFL